jgi:hypothetical protein
MSFITAGTTSTTSIVLTGDLTGTLVLQTNASTTALTLSTTGAIGVGTLAIEAVQDQLRMT